jgi:hypothetical protein
LGKWSGICLILAGLSFPARADEGLWSIGTRAQGFYDFEPGQDWFLGLEIGYSNYSMASHRLQLKAAYLTSRLEQVFRPNILKQDYFLFSPAWHFSRNGFFDPIVQMDLGYTRFDLESEIFKGLDNDSWIAAAQVGFALNLAQGEYGLYYHFGYNFITPESSMVYPGVFGLGLWIML